MKNRLSFAAAALIAVGAFCSSASASLVTYTAFQSGFSRDSDTVNAGFNAALGGGYTHLSFAGASSTNGASYSADVTFSTKASGYGGSNTGNVNAASEIGPFGNWYGILDIDFNGGFVSSVGFGLVDPAASIKVFDTSNNVLGVFNNNLYTTFSLWGVAATAGEQIGRVEIDGPFYAIQDIAFGAKGGSNVPDGGSTLASLALALLCLGARRLRSA